MGDPFKAITRELFLEAELDIRAASGDGPPRFTMAAYNGGMMRTRGMPVPVVVDIRGISWPARGVPILRDHDQAAVVGHSESIVAAGNTLTVDGVISGTGAAATEVVANARNGFAWSASIGAPVTKGRMIKAGETVTVNGQTFTGPFLLAEKVRLREVSVVAAGGDETATTLIAATYNGGAAMSADSKFQTWAADRGFDIEAMTADQAKQLKSWYQNEQRGGVKAAPASDEVTATVDQIREVSAAEFRRQEVIKASAERYGADPELTATALAENWASERFELECLKRSRPSAALPARGTNRQDTRPNAAVVEAAACMTLGVGEDVLAKQYGEQTMEKAHAMRGVGFREIAAMCAQIDGHDIPAVFGDGQVVVTAAVSTNTFASVASNVIGKVALAAYQSVDLWALQIARTRSVRDFKQVEAYRLTGGVLRKQPRGGQLQAGVLADQTYTNQADTYGLLYEIDRRDIVNDDISLLNDIGSEVGRAGANAINRVTAEKILGNAGTFWGTGNANYISGSGTVLSDAGLAEAWSTMRKIKKGPSSKTGDNTHPISVMPRILLVPPELESAAMRWCASPTIETGSTTATPSMNVWAGKLRPVGAPELSDATLSGYSATAWYLFADPSAVASVELAFLNGKQTPTLERRPRAAGYLGIAMEAVLDFGAALQDPAGSVKSKGAA